MFLLQETSFILLTLFQLFEGSENTNETNRPLPPTFSSPCIPKDIQRTYFTKQGESYAVIKWEEPLATDRNGDVPRVEQIMGVMNGGRFDGTIIGQLHEISYLATDKDGLVDYCYFNFSVAVPSCPKLGILQYGQFTCTNGTAPGSHCYFSCQEGFQLSGHGNITCGYASATSQFPTWNTIHRCKRIKCDEPYKPDNADLICTDNDNSYQSVCKVICKEGSIPLGPMFTMCQADGNWTKTSTCLVLPQDPDKSQCLSSLCNGHTCIKGNDYAFICKCFNGWSGSLCTVPPNFCLEDICMNDATCISQNSSYTCECSFEFSGSLCQIIAVDGGWSDWSFWSKCSVPCGSGFRTRTRSCDNPPPDRHGKICNGSYTEIISCDERDCEVCPNINQINQSLTNYLCTTDNTGLKTCVTICENGTIQTPWFKEFEAFECGQKTNLTWVPGNVQAPCTAPIVPKELRLLCSITYLVLISEDEHRVVKDKVVENINETKCMQSTYCNVTFSFSTEGNSKTVLELTFRRTFANRIKKSTAAIEEQIMAAKHELESTAEYLQNHTRDVFDVQTEDANYFVEETSLQFLVYVDCADGQIPIDGMCIDCPPGTYIRKESCMFCPRGTYQPLSGQTNCINCPPGETTYTVGSVYALHCYEQTAIKIEAADPLSDGSNIATILGPVIALVVAVPTFVACYYQIREMRNKKGETMNNMFCKKNKMVEMDTDL